jgi:hypothetical protein
MFRRWDLMTGERLPAVWCQPLERLGYGVGESWLIIVIDEDCYRRGRKIGLWGEERFGIGRGRGRKRLGRLGKRRWERTSALSDLVDDGDVIIGRQ